LYNQLYASILCKSKHFFQVHLYRVPLSAKAAPQILMHVLRLKRTGKFFLQIVDHLVLIHHLEERETLVFDIAYLKHRHRAISNTTVTDEASSPRENFIYDRNRPKHDKHGVPYYHDPIAVVPLETYSKSWRTSSANMIFSKKQKQLVKLDMQLRDCVPLLRHFQLMSHTDVIRFYQRRMDPGTLEVKEAIIKYITQTIQVIEDVPFGVLLEDMRPLESETTDPKTGKPKQSKQQNSKVPENVRIPGTSSHCRPKHFLSQSELLERVLLKYHAKNTAYFATLSVIRYARLYGQIVLEDLYYLAVRQLISAKQLPLLKLLILQKAISDNDQIACYLLKVKQTELGLDMFRRLGGDHVGQALEILMQYEQPERCTKFAVAAQREDLLNPARLLKQVSRDRMRFLAMYQYCLRRNQKLRRSTVFLKTDKCDEFIALYKKYSAKNKSKQMKSHSSIDTH